MDCTKVSLRDSSNTVVSSDDIMLNLSLYRSSGWGFCNAIFVCVEDCLKQFKTTKINANLVPIQGWLALLNEDSLLYFASSSILFLSSILALPHYIAWLVLASYYMTAGDFNFLYSSILFSQFSSCFASVRLVTNFASDFMANASSVLGYYPLGGPTII